MSVLSMILWGFFGLLLVIVLVVLSVDAIRKMSGSGLIFLIGLVALFLGERWLGESDWHLWVSGAASLVILVSLVLRGVALVGSEGPRRSAHQRALGFMGLSTFGLLLYPLTQHGMGLDGDNLERFTAVFTVLWPLLVLLGLVPTILLDRLLAVHPIALPAVSLERAVSSGLTLALAIALVVPVNYLASVHKKEWDLAYFRTTRPSSSTAAMVKGAADPIIATLFFAPGSEVKEEAVRYFDRLAELAGPDRFKVEVLDQPLAPKLAKQLKVRENGYVALRIDKEDGDVQKFKIGTEMDRARRELRKLDGTVQKHLLKLSRGQRVAYMLVGHGEASARTKDDPLRKLSEYKKILQEQNFKVKNWGGAQGSASAVPDDADVIIVAAPKTDLLPEEQAVLTQYIEDGGHLLVFLDPGADPLVGLLAELGVKAGTVPLANAQAYISQRRGKADRVFLVTNRYGSHDAVRTLSRNSTEQMLMMPTAVALERIDGWTKGKSTTIVRSMPNTWADADGDFERGKDEPAKVWELGYALEGKDGGPAFRAVVLSDVSVVSDAPLVFSRGNRNFALDSIRWLAGEEDFSGEESREEDVKIRHTHGDEVGVFFAAVFGVPIGIVIFGVLLVRVRRRKK